MLARKRYAAAMVRFFRPSCIMKATKAILRDILVSLDTGCVVKLKLKDTLNPVITAVDQVSNESILLKPTCLYGYPLKKRTISLMDIEKCRRYKTRFDHPMFARLRFVRNNFSQMRKAIALSATSHHEPLAT